MKRRGAPRGNSNARKHGAYTSNRSPGSAPPPAAVPSSSPPSEAASPSAASLVSIDTIIADLHARHVEVANYLNRFQPDPPLEGARADAYHNAQKIYTDQAYRLGRLLKLKKELTGSGEDVARAWAQALEAIGRAMGKEL